MSRAALAQLDLVRQCVCAIACGYEDRNDAAALRYAPTQLLLLGRDPLEGEPLGSQPTISRFGNRHACREARDNPRFVFTNLNGRPEAITRHHPAHHRDSAPITTTPESSNLPNDTPRALQNVQQRTDQAQASTTHGSSAFVTAPSMVGVRGPVHFVRWQRR